VDSLDCSMQALKRRQCRALGILYAAPQCSALGASSSGQDQQCRDFAELPCVFVVALGRTGSTHLLRLLNSISGYRLSGETDNAWVYMGWFARARLAKLQQAEAGGDDSTQKLLRRRPSVATLDLNSSDVLCDMRQMMLLLHNPSPRARVFGFKEIYSPFVRQAQLTGEIFRQGVQFVRVLFPRAKFIFHWRDNLTRIAASDFWRQESSRNQTESNFENVVSRFRAYPLRHPDHAFATTIEGLTNRSDPSQLQGLFDFLGERLTPKLRKVAWSRLPLHDYTEETRKRIVRSTNPSGSVQRVTTEVYHPKDRRDASGSRQR